MIANHCLPLMNKTFILLHQTKPTTPMELTYEQRQIIESTGNIKINAVAGSGKTTTVIEYAKARPSNSRILYLAFNKSVKLEAVKKFANCDLHNITVETAHSLAYKHTITKYGLKVRAQGYKTNEIADILNLNVTGEKHAEYVVANHINKYMAYFCNSSKTKVKDLNYLETLSDHKAKIFVTGHYNYIQSQVRQFLAKMDRGEIEVTHDFYLKKFQLANTTLNYDYILFDEGQDASPAMLDVFLKQKATKVIVGDTHQQIYGWRFAVNSLDKADFKTFHLSTSFRFSADIANLAMSILKFKDHINTQQPIKIEGKGCCITTKSKAILARTNFGLLAKAIEYTTEKREIKRIYFEGNFNSYTYADDGASLYDVLNLYNNKQHLIKDKLIKSMPNIDELNEYIEKTEDVQLGMMLEIVKEYGNKIPAILKSIKEKHVDNDDRDKAEIIFSTVHRSKGMEYDTVQLVNDFITEEKIVKLKEESAKDKLFEINATKINEEINLLYVAATRCKNSILIPKSLVPKELPPSAHIRILNNEKLAQVSAEKTQIKHPKTNHSTTENPKEKAYSLDEVRNTHKEAYRPWTAELDHELTLMYCEGINNKDLAKHFGRTRGAIESRIKKLELQ